MSTGKRTDTVYGATPAERSGTPMISNSSHDPRERLTIAEVIAELKVSRSTFYYWRQLGKAPRCTKLPNGEIRILRADLDAWLETYVEVA